MPEPAKRGSGPPSRSRRACTAFATVALLLASACIEAPRPTDWTPVPEPPADSVDSVVLLVGDAGEALPGHSPVLARLGREVETWSARLARDRAVSVVYLGDIVYPDGVRDRGTPWFPRDSVRVQAQVDVVSGPAARRHGTAGVFLAGNHDWGQMDAPDGLARLRNLGELLDAMALWQDVDVALVPDAGRPGPTVVDQGERARLVLLDTHWWLQVHGDAQEDSVVFGVADALRTAGAREVVIAAHHPYLSGGAHGGPMPIWEGLGLLWLLRKTGSLVQDINSIPYRELRLSLRAIFGEERRPLVWAGGHDHSLQVLGATQDDEPLWTVVSGSGSKLTGVARTPGMRYGADRPGFMRLTFLRDGAVDLHVLAAEKEYLLCDGDERPVETCMEEGVEDFHVVWATRLRQARVP